MFKAATHKELYKNQIQHCYRRTVFIKVSNSAKPGKGIIAINRFIASDFTPFILHWWLRDQAEKEIGINRNLKYQNQPHLLQN